MARKPKKSQIKHDLIDQLERQGIYGAQYLDLIDDYMKLYDIKNKLIADAKKNPYTEWRNSETSATPHTRGSTSPNQPDMLSHNGYPAHAGIDPSVLRAGRTTRRLPRTRGDRPVKAVGGSGGETATPHTRGSTPCVEFAE